MKKYEFRTIVAPAKAIDAIDVGVGMLFMGSCFATNIGRHVENARLPVLINPFGTLYNPLSILLTLENIIENRQADESTLVYQNGLWHSFEHHGSLSHPDVMQVLTLINHATSSARAFLMKAGFLMVTFGTAFVYENRETGKVVANCHKFPESRFNRYMLNVDEIVGAWKELIIKLRILNPYLRVIFSVSPVRYWRDGAHGNQLSKATLLLAVDRLTSLFDKSWYFPAHEIVLDELRDYRFFDADMLQPNQQAIDYIWHRFIESQFTPAARQYCGEVEKIVRAREHRPSGYDHAGRKAFLRQMIEYTEALATRYPLALLESDKVFFQEELDKLSFNNQ